jgi:hypothetical protein
MPAPFRSTGKSGGALPTGPAFPGLPWGVPCTCPGVPWRDLQFRGPFLEMFPPDP